MATRQPFAITLPPSLVKKVERLAKRRRQTAAEFVRTTLTKHIDDMKLREALWKEEARSPEVDTFKR